MDNPITLILTRRDVAALLRPADYRAAVSTAFKAAAEGLGVLPSPMHLPTPDGGFHVKGAGFAPGDLTGSGRAYVAFKVNGNFPANPQHNNLPTIQGAIVLCDGSTGAVLAIIDSIEITLQRTAAASAVAAAALARPESSVITVCGCGAQGKVQLDALSEILPLQKAFLWDRDPARAASLAHHAAKAGLDAAVVEELSEATRASDIIVTCTTAREPFLTAGRVRPGSFICAVGADSPEKSEVHSDLMACSTVVVDVLAQCLVMGDLHHAVDAGTMNAAQVHASLGEILTGRRCRRQTVDEVIVFDSTGTAIQDVASAAMLYERALEAGAGLSVPLGAAPASDSISSV